MRISVDLPAPFFPNNSVDLGRKEIEVYVIDGARRPESLDHSAHAYDGGGGFRERVFAQTVFGGLHEPHPSSSMLQDRNANKVIVDKHHHYHSPSVDPLVQWRARLVPKGRFYRSCTLRQGFVEVPSDVTQGCAVARVLVGKSLGNASNLIVGLALREHGDSYRTGARRGLLLAALLRAHGPPGSPFG